MLHFTRGNLLEAQVEAIVNTVNTVGVMGKGIALQVKEAYPEVDAAYRAACERGEVQIGRMHVVPTQALQGPRFVINFPTKKHWRNPSKLEYIVAGLEHLKGVLQGLGVRSVALPPLGCGSGGLEWPEVKDAIVAALGDLAGIDLYVFEPSGAPAVAPKRGGAEELTPARALIVEGMRRYAVLGFECTNLEVQKLAYFTQRVLKGLGLRDELDLKFVEHIYGPYSDRLRHTLAHLDGSYLHCEKRIADAGPLEPIYLDLPRLAALDDYWKVPKAASYRPAIDRTEQIIDGFQTPFLMELLATVDWMMQDGAPDLTVERMRERLSEWAKRSHAAERKLRLFGEAEIRMARGRLLQHREVLYPAAATGLSA